MYILFLKSFDELISSQFSSLQQSEVWLVYLRISEYPSYSLSSQPQQ